MNAVIEKVSVSVFRTVSKLSRDSDGHTHPGEPHEVRQALLRITDSDGATGYCLTSADQLRESVLDGHVRNVLLGQDGSHRERLWHEMARTQRGAGGGFTDRALVSVDMALWDLEGRRLDTPVWKLLGGGRTKVPAYGSTMCGDEIPGGLATPEDYAAFAAHLVGRGYRAVKLHTWMPPVSFAPDIGMDANACAAVREAVGPDVPLMLDANHWYTRMEALALGRSLEKLDYYWYEEPMEEASLQSYKWLADQLDIPVIGPETAGGKGFTRADWIVGGACDIVRAGVGDCGGITPTMKIVHLAEAFNMECEIHGGGAGNLAVLGGTIFGRWYERGLLHPHYDYDDAPPHLHSNVDAMDAEGNISMPTAPGLGVDLNLAYIEDNTITSW
ncbi:MAG TPA: enolase C-terminal domain-like protein [Actinopolymorphaceae bacterium]|nr:enolase C-terminal domain-like protein [Actinopolymorphaceae bacterium]